MPHDSSGPGSPDLPWPTLEQLEATAAQLDSAVDAVQQIRETLGAVDDFATFEQIGMLSAFVTRVGDKTEALEHVHAALVEDRDSKALFVTRDDDPEPS